MTTGDILYSNICNSPLVVMVRRGDGQFWDFKANAFAAATKPIAAQFCLAMTPDAILPTTQRCVVPAAATTDPQAELIEATLPGSGGPQPTQSFWIGAPGGVTLDRATGSVTRYTA